GCLVAGFSLSAGHPFPSFGPANHVTMARLAIAGLIAAAIAEPPQPALAGVLTAAALITIALDGVDGRLGRASSMSSVFGARFDMETDALIILTLSILSWRYDKAGAWVVLAGAIRYLFVAAGWMCDWLTRPLPPSRRRQAVCVVQIATLAGVM